MADDQMQLSTQAVWQPTWNEMKEIAVALAKSGLMPASLNTPEKVLATLLVARDLRLPPSSVLRGGLYVVNGVVSANGALIMSLILRSDLVDVEVQRGPEWVEVTMRRRDTNLSYTARWDRERVEKSRVNFDFKNNREKTTWKFHFDTMLYWRAVTEAGRAVAPDIIMGLYTPDELEDMDIVEISGASIPEETKPEPEPEISSPEAQELLPEPKEEFSRPESSKTEDSPASLVALVEETASKMPGQDEKATPQMIKMLFSALNNRWGNGSASILITHFFACEPDELTKAQVMALHNILGTGRQERWAEAVATILSVCRMSEEVGKE